MIDNLKIGDRIVISGGIHGRITNVSENTIIVEIAEKVKVRTDRASVTSMFKTNSQNSPNKVEENKK